MRFFLFLASADAIGFVPGCCEKRVARSGSPLRASAASKNVIQPRRLATDMVSRSVRVEVCSALMPFYNDQFLCLQRIT